MKRLKGALQVGALGLALATFAGEASATAISQVQRNFFYVQSTYGTVGGTNYGSPWDPVDGITVSLVSQTISTTITTWGNANVNFAAPIFSQNEDASSFRAAIGGMAVANPDGYAFGTYTLSLTLAFTNQSGIDFDFLAVRTGFSTFDRTGNPIGAIVNDAALEFARFSSGQSGPGIGGGHHCDTRLGPGTSNHTYAQTPPGAACGVNSPDSSQWEFDIVNFDDGETETRTYILTYTLEAQSIPEPSTLVLLGAAMIGLVGVGAVPKRAKRRRQA